MIVIVALGAFALGVLLTTWFAKAFLGLGTSKSESDKPFWNGLHWSFALKVVLGGGTPDTIFRMLTQRNRNRLYVGWKKWFFFGDQLWFIGHPAMAKAVFAGNVQKDWFKLDKAQTQAFFYQKPVPRDGMVYAGDSDAWKHSRMELSPYFYKYDFALLDEKMDFVVKKHLSNMAAQHHGSGEMLELLFYITVDLICKCLFDCSLPPNELDILVDSLAFYVSSTTEKEKFPGGLSALEYHVKVANEMAADAPENTVGHIIMHECPSMSPSLRRENVAFFMEALTPAFASFWTVSNIIMTGCKDEALKDPVFRQKCIKESLRMYPPVPYLWPREAKKDMEVANPIFNPLKEPAPRSLFSKLFGGKPVEEQPFIKIPKGTKVMLFPSCIHYDDRFWVKPYEFMPSRWDKQPDILVGESAKLNTTSRISMLPGKGGQMGYASGRVSMLTSKTRSKTEVEKTLRAKVFSPEVEIEQAEANKDHLFECTAENMTEMQAWSYLPFGLGPHTCLGRRLAVRMVDAIVYACLEYDAAFYNGIIPSLFSRKPWHARTLGIQGAYNFPADPVHIQLKKPKSQVVRKSVMSTPISD